jgi:hypothetical protein
MSNPLLSILIPTTPDREMELGYLIWSIKKQSGMASKEVKILYDWCVLHYISFLDIGFPIEIMIANDDKEISIGEKRERLYNIATGVYSWQIDSDDDIADNAIELILEAIKQEPDCITFQEHCMINGVHLKSNHSLDYGDWEGDGQRLLADGFHYHRTPFMKSVIKTEIARSVPIPHIRFGEDHQWAQALKPHLKTQCHMHEDIYFYQHTSTPHNERYGIK